MNPAIVLQFDLRHGPQCPDTQQDRYQACLEMVKWADNNRVSVVGFSEHHNTADGFLSSPMMMAMGAAQFTERVGISVSALLLPLHDPIRVAEDIAVLDLVSNGRFVAVAGLWKTRRCRSLLRPPIVPWRVCWPPAQCCKVQMLKVISKNRKLNSGRLGRTQLRLELLG